MPHPHTPAVWGRNSVVRSQAEDNCLSDKSMTSLCLWTNRVSAAYLRPVDTLQQQFGHLVRSRRLAAGLGQEALADKAGLHRTHVSLLERGMRMPSLIVVKKLAAALETTMSSLMAELEDEGRPTSKRKKSG